MEEGTANPDVSTQQSGNENKEITNEGRKDEKHPIDQAQKRKEVEDKNMEAEATNPDVPIRQSRKNKCSEK